VRYDRTTHWNLCNEVVLCAKINTSFQCGKYEKSRTIARKSSIDRLYVCAWGLNATQNYLFIVFHISIWGGTKPTKDPPLVATGWRRDFIRNGITCSAHIGRIFQMFFELLSFCGGFCNYSLTRFMFSKLNQRVLICGMPEVFSVCGNAVQTSMIWSDYEGKLSDLF